MEIRKSTFDYSPSLIEYEGNTIRINFDVEQIELANGMDSGESKGKATRLAYAADEEHEAEYEAMQDWRTKAKAVATDVGYE